MANTAMDMEAYHSLASYRILVKIRIVPESGSGHSLVAVISVLTFWTYEILSS